MAAFIQRRVRQRSGSRNRPDLARGNLACKCTDRPSRCRSARRIAHNPYADAPSCWRPKGVLFSMIAVVFEGNKVKVTQNGAKLGIGRSSTKTIKSYDARCAAYTCTAASRNNKHAFYGLDLRPRIVNGGRVGRKRSFARPSDARGEVEVA